MRIIHLLSDTQPGLAIRLTSDLCRQQTADGHVVDIVSRRGKFVDSLLPKEVARHFMALKGGIDVVSPVKLSKLIDGMPENRAVVFAYSSGDVIVAARARALAARYDVKIIFFNLSLERRRIIGGISSMVDAVIFPTEYGVKLFQSAGNKLDSDRIYVVKPAVTRQNLENFPVSVKDSNVPSVLLAGELYDGKALMNFVEAIAKMRHKPVRAIVVGEGVGNQVVPAMRAARRMGVADMIDWRGWGNGVIDSAIEECQVAVCPETDLTTTPCQPALYEAYPISVVATDLPVYHELMPENTVFAKTSGESLAHAIDAILDVPASVANEQSFTEFAEKINEIMRKLLMAEK